MRNGVAPLFCALLALVSCCGQPAVGYQGPLPSVAARQGLKELWGRQLPAGSVAFTKNEIELVAFVVGPHGPTVNAVETKTKGDAKPKRHWITVLTDGDIADLHKRVTGKGPAGLVGDLSTTYRKQMTGR